MDKLDRLNSALEGFEDSVMIPKGLRSIVYDALDQCIASGTQQLQIELISRLSVAIQKLEWAMIKRDDERISEAWLNLCELKGRWLENNIATH